MKIYCSIKKRLQLGQAIFIKLIEYNLIRRFECIDDEIWTVKEVSIVLEPNQQSIKYQIIAGDYNLSSEKSIQNIFHDGH